MNRTRLDNWSAAINKIDDAQRIIWNYGYNIGEDKLTYATEEEAAIKVEKACAQLQQACYSLISLALVKKNNAGIGTGSGPLSYDLAREKRNL